MSRPLRAAAVEVAAGVWLLAWLPTLAASQAATVAALAVVRGVLRR